MFLNTVLHIRITYAITIIQCSEVNSKYIMSYLSAISNMLVVILHILKEYWQIILSIAQIPIAVSAT